MALHGGTQVIQGAPRAEDRAKEAHITSERVWKEINKQSFMIESHISPAGEPRASGVVYRAIGHRLYMVVARDSLKARQIGEGQQVALTIPVRRGGVFLQLLHFPPAMITFHAKVSRVLSGETFDITRISSIFRLMPLEERKTTVVLEMEPEDEFLTWGVAVPLPTLRDPIASRAHVPVA